MKTFLFPWVLGAPGKNRSQSFQRKQVSIGSQEDAPNGALLGAAACMAREPVSVVFLFLFENQRGFEWVCCLGFWFVFGGLFSELESRFWWF